MRKDFSRALEDRYEHAETHKISRARPPKSTHNILHRVFSAASRAIRLSPKFLPATTSQTNSRKSPPDRVHISTSDEALELLSVELNGLSLALRDLRSEYLTRLAPPFDQNANYVLIEEIFCNRLPVPYQGVPCQNTTVSYQRITMFQPRFNHVLVSHFVLLLLPLLCIYTT